MLELQANISFKILSIFVFSYLTAGSEVQNLEVATQRLNSPPFRRIISGTILEQEEQLGNVPYMISFKRRQGTGDAMMCKHFCAGTLISADKIVSAAHCFYKDTTTTPNPTFYKCTISDDDVQVFAVTVGFMGSTHCPAKIKKISSPTLLEQWAALREIKFANKYHPGSFKDICVVFTCREFVLGNEETYFIPHILPYARIRENYVGQCAICGYGQQDMETPNALSNNISAGHIFLPGDQKCNKMVPKTTDSTFVICGWLNMSYGAWGDSGGGLVCSGTMNIDEDSKYGILVGVYVAYLKNRCCLYVRVTAYDKLLAYESKVALRLGMNAACANFNTFTSAVKTAVALLLFVEKIYCFL